MADTPEEEREIVAAEDLAAPAGPDEHVDDIKTSNRMKGIVRFSRASRILVIAVVVIVGLVGAYGFGLFNTAKPPEAEATTAPLATAPKAQAVQTSGDDSGMETMLKNAPAGIGGPARGGLPPLASGSLRGGKPASRTASNAGGPGAAPGNDQLGAALNDAANSPAQPAGAGPMGGTVPVPQATFDTSGPTIPQNDGPASTTGGAVPNPGAVNPSQPSFAEQARQQQAQQQLTERMNNQTQAKKASFYVGNGNRGEGGDLPAQASPGPAAPGYGAQPGQPGSGGAMMQNPDGSYGGEGGTPGGGQGSGGTSHIAFNNGQGGKGAYLTDQEQNPIGKYELWAGSIIPAQLDTGINTDLPGPVIAHVQKDVYDSKTGLTLVIPRGTRLIGRYNSVIQTGQIRVQVVWDRMIWPDGRFISLDGMIGAEPEGQAGLYADVQDHRGRIIGASLFTALISAGAQALASRAGGNAATTTVSGGQVLEQNVGGALAQTGQQFISKQSDVQNELTVPKAKPFDVLLDRTMVLQPWTYQP